MIFWLVFVNMGIVFWCIDFDLYVDIYLCVNVVGNIMLCICLNNEDGVSIYIVEYFVFVLVGLGIDNIIVEVNSNELLIMDGSVSFFVFLL